MNVRVYSPVRRARARVPVEKRTHTGAPCARRGDDGILSWRILVDVRVESAVARRQLACPFVCELSAGASLALRNDSGASNEPAAIVRRPELPKRIPPPSPSSVRARKSLLLFTSCLVSETIPLSLPSPPPAAYIRRSIAMTDGFSVNFKHDLFTRTGTPILQPDYPMPKMQGIYSNVFTIAEGK